MPATIVNIPVIVSGFTFLAILCLWWGVSLYLRQQSKSRAFKEKVHWGSEGAGGVVAGGPTSLTSKDAAAQPVLGYISRLGKMVASEQSRDYSRMKINFLKAGFQVCLLSLIYNILYHPSAHQNLTLLPSTTKVGRPNFLIFEDES